ncbi:MAG TPA: right-handed parallel beta-helix repeat-containing protein, partial [Gemmatimonadales bacterium]|nr:right-handed parallel beta-helix repeat-containing protein [Gemmatimonadales bacterium]
APGLTDTTTVTVGARHRWVVNAPGAQGQASEVGSDLYPFSTIKQALDRAVDGDTIVIRYGRYSDPLTTTKRLVFLGDSTASGFPLIVVPDGAAGVITRAGRQVMRQLQFVGARTGLTIRADTVDLTSLTFVSIGGPALRIFGFTDVSLYAVAVSGARGAGIWVDSAAGSVVDIRRSLVAGVEPDSQALRFGDEYALHAAGIFVRADSVSLDSVAVRAVERSAASDTAMVAGILTVGARRTLVRRSTVTDIAWDATDAADSTRGVGIGADSAVTLDVGTVSLQRIGGEGLAMAGDTIRLDSAAVSEVRGALVEAGDRYHVQEITDVFGTDVGFVARGQDGGRSTSRRVSVDRVAMSAFDPGADTITLDSVSIGSVDLTGFTCGLELDSNAAFARVNYASFRHAGYGLGVCSKEPGNTGDPGVRQSGYVSILNTAFDGPYTAIHVHADSLLLRNNTIRAVGWGIWQHPGGPRATRWLDVRNVRIRSLLYEGIYADSVVDWLAVVGSEIDGTQSTVVGGCGTCSAAIELYDVGDVRVDSVNFHDNFAGALEASGARSLRMYGNTITGSYRATNFSGYSEVPPAVLLSDVPWVLFRRNTVTESDNSGIKVLANNGDSVTVDSNTVRTARATYGYYSGIGIFGVFVSGDYFPADTAQDGRVVIRDNTFKGTGRPSYYPEDNVVVATSLSGSVIVERNAIDSTGRTAVQLEAVDTAIARNNTLSATGNGTNGQAVIAYGARQSLVQGNTVTCGPAIDVTYGIMAGYANAEVSGNTVRACRYGVLVFDAVHYSFSSPHVHDRVVVRGNTVQDNGALLDYGITSTGPTHPPVWEIVGNTIQGATQAAIMPTPDSATVAMRIDSNTVTSDTVGGAVPAFPEREGIVVPFSRVDTVVVRGNSVTVGGNGGLWIDGRHWVRVEQNTVTARKGLGMNLALSGATGVRARVAGNTFQSNLTNGMRVARSDSSGTYDSLRIVGNTFRSNRANGLLVDSVLATFVFIDSNLVVDNTLAGIRLHRPAIGSYNSIRRNADGLVYQGSGSGVTFQSNNFEDNTGYGVRNLNADTVVVNAINSWWGDTLGPACDATSDWGCNASSTGDSLTSFRVLHSPSATDTVVGTPAGAPPALTLGLAAPVARAIAVAPAEPPAAPVASTDPAVSATPAAAPHAAPVQSLREERAGGGATGGGGGGTGTPAPKVKRRWR